MENIEDLVGIYEKYSDYDEYARNLTILANQTIQIVNKFSIVSGNARELIRAYSKNSGYDESARNLAEITNATLKWIMEKKYEPRIVIKKLSEVKSELISKLRKEHLKRLGDIKTRYWGLSRRIRIWNANLEYSAKQERFTARDFYKQLIKANLNQDPDRDDYQQPDSDRDSYQSPASKKIRP